jgi:hypothetical protein
MAKLTIFNDHPQGPDETVAAYITRLATIYPNKPFHSLDRNYRRHKQKGFVTVKKTLNASGQVVSQVDVLRQDLLHNYDLPIHRVSTNVTLGQQWVIQQRSPKEATEATLKELLSSAIENLSKTPIKFKSSHKYESKLLNNYITDVHAGMDASGGFMNYDWNSKLLIEAFNTNLNDVLTQYNIYGRFEAINIIDLGDTLDGYEGLTTRGGHQLPQNMTTEQQFQLVLDVYLNYIEALLKHDVCNKLIITRVTNDNHGGTLNQLNGNALQTILTRLYPKANIEFRILSDFMSFNVYGEHAEVFTHGKDKIFMKANMPYDLTPKWTNYLNSVFKRWGISNKKIRVYKGDLHRLGMSDNQFFQYYNMQAFSPPSGWAQHNFGANASGYSIHIFDKNRTNVTKIDQTFSF